MHDDACGVAKFGATFFLGNENSRICRELELRLFQSSELQFFDAKNEGTTFGMDISKFGAK